MLNQPSSILKSFAKCNVKVYKKESYQKLDKMRASLSPLFEYLYMER